MFFGFDPTYILVIIGILITLWAQSKVNNTFRKYSQVQSACGLTGRQVAERILRSNDIYGVTVQQVAGSLTDYYDPARKVVCLSDDIYASTSVAAISVAAHECGHAIQDALEYAPLRFRTSFVPLANIGSRLAWPVLIVGMMLGGVAMNSRAAASPIGGVLIKAGIILFSLSVVFQLITLPVEFDASDRALRQLQNLDILSSDESQNAKSVLKAAALTYVAAAAAGLLSFLRVILLFGGGRNKRR